MHERFAGPAARHRLFFALRPEAATAAEIASAAAALRTQGLVRGSWVAPAKYHLTLHFLGDHADPRELCARAADAASALVAASCRVTLTSAASFARARRSPCVLRCDAASEATIRSLREPLGSLLAERGVPIEDRYTPHVTIAYGDFASAQPLPIAPIAWVATHFSLIDSLVGQSLHEELARWPLGGGAK
ncbi:MAG TPA: RNA 2',3'-cyclic phosphodiesterase [Rudaea sp.]|nr:RNA 2',3'-cyclic phosphodiesterase [Rudaea sp.]